VADRSGFLTLPDLLLRAAAGQGWRADLEDFAKSLIFHKFRELPRISVDNIVGKSWTICFTPREKGAGSGLLIK